MNRNNAGNPRNYDFSRVPSNTMSRTRMYRPGSHMTTIGTDYLYPLFVDEVLPGDTFRLDVATFARMTSALVPFMSNVLLDWQFFFVPTRLVWEHWQNFCGEQDNPTDSIDYTVPYLNPPSGGATTGSIFDYMGLPPGKTWDDHDVMALPFRAYNLIWNEWYRDENLQNSVTVNKGDSADSASTYTLLKRGKRKDYFTSALPWPQKGPEAVVPLVESGTTVPVMGTGMALGLSNGTATFGLSQNSAAFTTYVTNYGANVGTANSGSTSSASKAVGVTTDKAKSGLQAVFDATSAVSINELRSAFQMQKFLERLARGGTRYIEILKAMFGVTSPDARLQRPELLTSFSVPLQIYQNVQTSASVENGSPQGNLAANGTIAGSRFAFSKSFVEHGYILGLASIRSDLLYQQGLHRMWSRKTRYDFYWPTFAHLGEQAILNKEIYLQDKTVVDSDSNVVNDNVFGYQERWSEYKYGQHRVSGELRSQYAQSLDVWHLGQYFQSLPKLNSTFIEENVPIDRVIAVNSDTAKPFVIDVAYDLVCVRPLPLYDVPGLVDHF